MRQIIIKENEAGQRLDKFLNKYMDGAPKSFLYKMLRKKNIVLNGKKAEGREKLAKGDEVKLFLAEDTIEKFSGRPKAVEVVFSETQPKPDIIFEDRHVCLMNKPWGILSQKAKETDISMNELFLSYLLESGQVTQDALLTFRPAVCNRLDRNTTGLLIGGKTLLGLQVMSRLLKERSLHKFYRCIVAGEVEKDQKICGYLKKNQEDNQVTVTEKELPGSSYIETAYHVLKSNGTFTYLEVQLITGRTHQIRAHLASIGHPVLGDGKYGDEQKNRTIRSRYHLRHLLLHSYRMQMPELDGEFCGLSGKSFTAPLPVVFKTILRGEELV